MSPTEKTDTVRFFFGTTDLYTSAFDYHNLRSWFRTWDFLLWAGFSQSPLLAGENLVSEEKTWFLTFRIRSFRCRTNCFILFGGKFPSKMASVWRSNCRQFRVIFSVDNQPYFVLSKWEKPFLKCSFRPSFIRFLLTYQPLFISEGHEPKHTLLIWLHLAFDLYVWRHSWLYK